ncbi:MAG: hypothetical protein H0Z24_05065 [Thermosipho sp. (in: Bacteria)]|nr:hypothetical protein [Thermosipho sp. (in: thermotogales)]
MKKSLIFLLLFIVAIVFSGSFGFFDKTFVLESPPVLIAIGDNSFGVGLVYSTSTTSYVETKIGMLKIKRPSEREMMDFSIFVGSIYGLYVSIGYENLNYPVSFQKTEFFVSNKFSFITSNSKSFYAIGPLSLNVENNFLKKDNDFEYTFSRYFGKYKNSSGYLLKICNNYFLGYLYPLDVSLEQGLLIGIGTNDFTQLFLNAGVRRYFSAGDFRGFAYSYFYVDAPEFNKVSYFSGLKFLAPLKGDLIVWDGKFAFKINW